MLTPADLVEIRKIMVATHLVTSGQFDKELIKIDEATKRLDDKHKTLGTLEAAEKALQNANRLEYNAKVKIQKEEEAFLQKVAAFEVRYAEFLKNKEELDVLRNTEKDAIEKARIARKQLADSLDTDRALLSKELQRSAKITDELNERNLAITKRENALNERIERMRALAA